MTRPVLTIDLDAIAGNWAALDALSGPQVETGAVVKADAYGLGIVPVARRLLVAGVRNFFVAFAAEAVALREAVGPEPGIHVFSGYMKGDADALEATGFCPMLNSPEQIARFRADFPDRPCGLQLDTGMHRLGLEPSALADTDVAVAVSALDLRLVASHLACADAPGHPQNARQRERFARFATGFPGIPLSCAATGGILLGSEYHFDMTRPGIGLYGGAPYLDAAPVVTLDIPVIQTRAVTAGDHVGYGAAWTAPRPARIATIAAGYADGLIRAMGNSEVQLFAGDVPCPLVGRVSMDLLTVDVTPLDKVPDTLRLMGRAQGIDALASAAGTIGYEILTSLGPRYERVYKGSD